MPISVTATEVARNFNGVMEKARAAGSVTVIKNSRPIAPDHPDRQGGGGAHGKQSGTTGKRVY